MRVATFDLDRQLLEALGAVATVLECAPGAAEEGDAAELPAALEGAERELDGTGATAAVIAGAGPWALAGALAAAKAVIPYAYLRRGEGPDGYGGHLERLAAAVIDGRDDPAGAVRAWLETLGDS